MMRALDNPTKQVGRRGVAMIVSLGMLSLLGSLALLFVASARVERTCSRNYVDLVRARLLATSGVEAALASVTNATAQTDARNQEPPSQQAPLSPQDEPSPSPAPNTLASGPARLVNAKTFYAYGAMESNPTADSPAPVAPREERGPVRRTAAEEASPDVRKFSGRLPGTYRADGDAYEVTCSDLSARLNVNMAGHPHLRQVLENLAEEAGLDRMAGTRVFAARPYTSMVDLENRSGLTPQELDVMRGLVTALSWSDRTVVQPVPLARRRGRGLRVGDDVQTWEELRPRSIDMPRDDAGTVSGRAPVNVNAAPPAVLVALLDGLQGFTLDEETPGTPVNSAYEFARMRESDEEASGRLGRITLSSPISRTAARRVVAAIVERRARRPFISWSDFQAFVDLELLRAGILDERQADALLANVDPNTRLNDFNPDRARHLSIDKTDLTYWTTELTFAPTGCFEVRSTGRVSGPDGTVAAEAKLHVEVRLFDVFRWTSQRDFLRELWRDGKELTVTTISAERGAGTTTGGWSIAAHPELPERKWVEEADYDGYLTLATIESASDDAAFRASFWERGLGAETGQAPIPDLWGPWIGRLVDARGSDPTAAGKLFLDGVYCELDSVPMFAYTPPTEGDFAVSFWVKPHFLPERSGRTRVFLTWQKWNDDDRFPVMPMGVYSTVTGVADESSEGGYEYGETWDTPALLAGGTVGKWVGACASPCLNHLRHGHSEIVREGETWGTLLAAGQWIHVGWVHRGSAFVDRPREEQAHLREDLDTLYINGRKLGGAFRLQTHDVRRAVSYEGEPLRLGERRGAPALNTVPDSTIDEVLVWEVPAEEGERRVLAEFGAGRYYAGDEARFTSAPIDLSGESGGAPGESVRLISIQATGLVPDGLPSARIGVEWVDAATGKPLPGARIDAREGLRPVGLAVRRPVRFVVRMDAGTLEPVLETPILDDVTACVAHQPRFAAWVWLPR